MTAASKLDPFRLPDVLRTHVASFLDDTTFFRTSQVCKTWHDDIAGFQKARSARTDRLRDAQIQQWQPCCKKAARDFGYRIPQDVAQVFLECGKPLEMLPELARHRTMYVNLFAPDNTPYPIMRYYMANQCGLALHLQSRHPMEVPSYCGSHFCETLDIVLVLVFGVPRDPTMGLHAIVDGRNFPSADFRRSRGEIGFDLDARALFPELTQAPSEDRILCLTSLLQGTHPDFILIDKPEFDLKAEHKRFYPEKYGIGSGEPKPEPPAPQNHFWGNLFFFFFFAIICALLILIILFAP